MTDPFEDDIATVMEVTGLVSVDDRSLVMQALKSVRSVENVINEFYNDPDGFRKKYSSKWDDGMFSADRDGSQNAAGTSFHIEAPDQTPQSEVIYGVEPPPDSQVGAPSRPPSRANAPSPLERVVDWTAANSGAVPRSHAQEEEEIQRALRESAQEAGISMPVQESGVTEALMAGPQFGPANRDDYDASQWSMVPTAMTAPIEPQAAPSKRKREQGTPAFLVQGPSEFGAHRLGAFLTILHEIPLVRNLLLQAGSSVASYGHNTQWWKGQQIIPPHVLARLSAGETKMEDGPEMVNFEEELHRLMAFLDSTERSYGTVTVLAHLIPSAWTAIERQFCENLGARNAIERNPFYSSVIIEKAQGEDGGAEEQKFCVLESQATKQDFASIKTLYELLDHIMWSDVLSWYEDPDEARMAVLRDMGDIFTIDMAGEGPPKSTGFSIPEELYPERWLESRKDEALRIQMAWKETKNAIVKVNEAKAKLYQLHDAEAGRVHDKRQVAMRAQELFDACCEYLEGRGRFRTVEESGFDLDKYPEYRAAPCQMTDEEKELYKKLRDATGFAQRVLNDWRSKMDELNQELKKIEAKQRFLGKLLTEPNKPGRPKPMTCKKFLLQGIAAGSDVVYVCRRSKVDLIELDDEPPNAATDQWWRLAYAPSDEAKPVKAEQLDYAQVLDRVWEDTRTPLLVYASEKAVYADSIPLPNALERFVKADNKAFRQELHQEVSDHSWEKEVEAAEVKSPSKRKHRADSMDSMASDRASAGSEDSKRTHDIFVESDKDDETVAVGPMQKRAYGEQPDKDRMDLDVSDAAPVLPKRHPASTENTSTTLTPGEGGSPASRETQKTTPSELREVTGDSALEETKGPEMQERFQMPTLRRLLSSEKSEVKPSEAGDMELE